MPRPAATGVPDPTAPRPTECAASGASESLMHTGEYMADANALALPLVDGHLHDWRWLFERAGVLPAAEEIGLAVHVLASLAALTAVWLGARVTMSA